MKCPTCGVEIPLEKIASEMGKAGGSRSTRAKRRASRLNGLKGGRPRKVGNRKR